MKKPLLATPTALEPDLVPLGLVCRVYREMTGRGAPFSYRNLLAAACDAMIPAVRGPNSRWVVARRDIPALPGRLAEQRAQAMARMKHRAPIEVEVVA
jgi:hypothetical protein